MSSELKVAACQMQSIDDQTSNQNQVLNFLKNFENSKLDLVSFPENALYFRLRAGDTIRGVSKDESFFRELASWAKQHQTCVHLGSVPLTSGAKLLNATVWIDREGHVQFPYSKIHLFDVDVAGEKPVRESESFEAGASPRVMQIGEWKIALSICYDLRFSELYLHYAKQMADVILIPSAFLVTTGQAHWHTLLRARAIESQAYVVAAAQGGEHQSKSGDKRHTFGHSLIVDPWGLIVAEVNNDSREKFVIQTLSREKISQVRRQIPMQSHRKL